MTRAHDYWLEVEDDLIERFYPTQGSRGVQKALKAIGRHRTRHSIKGRARLLGYVYNRIEAADTWDDDNLGWPIPAHTYDAPDAACRAWRCATPGLVGARL